MRRMSVCFTYRWLRLSVRLLIGSTPGREAGTVSRIITRLLSSRPVMPVGHFRRAAGVGKGGSFFIAAWSVLLGEAPETAVVPDQRAGSGEGQKAPEFYFQER